MISQCKTCKFFLPKFPEESCAGYCRRYPPMETSGKFYTRFPFVNYHNWCGEWKEKTMATNESAI
jgi:hypothetical protein